MALLDLGGVVRTKEAIRNMRGLSVEAIWLDTRYALRGMRKRPGFSSLAAVTLALGIGVNAASLAVAYGILVRPLPYVEPSRVIILNLLFADGGDLGFSPGTLQEWLPRLRTVDVAAGYYRREVTVRSGDRSTVIPGAVVTDRFFDVLGTAAEVGHTRIRIDSPEVVIGRRVINEILGRNASEPVGVFLSVSDKAHSIGGVVPSDFAFPDDEIGLWLPSAVLRAGTKSEDSGYSKIIARLKSGVTLEQLRDDANRVRLELNPKSREMVSVAVLGESVVGGMRTLLIAVLVGALLVLVVACANVATLFIGRDVSRQREMAARIALGASRSQLARSVLVETLLIALIASLAGMGLGAVTLKIFLAQASGVISGLHRVVIGLPIAIAIAGLTVLVTLLCGAVPAWYAARTDFRPFLGATMGPRPRAWRVRRTLVIAQIALSCVLLVGAGLLARTVSVLMREDHGFQPSGALEVKVVLSDRILFDGTGRQTFVRDLLERVRAMPGVQHVGFGTNLPPRTPPITIAIRLVADARLTGLVRDETRFMKAGSGTPGYLRALGARFVAGRDFEESDDRPEAPVVILSESVARFYFRDEDPIGRTIARLPAMFGMTGNPRVIGVVRDIKYEGLDSLAGSAIYLPWALRPLGSGYLIVRTGDDPMRLAVAIRRAAHDLDPTVPVPELQSLDEVIAQSIANRRVRALPAIGFGVLALAVAFVGVLAALMTLVAERRRDLAIRSALGASPGHLVWTIMAEGFALTAFGLVLGLGVASAAGRALSSLLYRVSPLDATTFVGTALLIGGGALLTTYLAALRTRGVDPLVIFRYE
jgi:putative ABC transport system permease protein